VIGIWRHGIVAPPKQPLAAETPEAADSGELSSLIAEARREV
jgi:hypothetical protein